jgi:hypothetical protein
VLGRDAQWVQQPGETGVGAQRDRLDVRGDLVEQVEAMIALRSGSTIRAP